ncbi:MAG: hypothetical protein LBU82_06665 [Treponema sp.]|jgi:hypothetical protein|nr:hypothetical protein [Treponema sp.]
MESMYGEQGKGLPGMKFGIHSDMESIAAGENIYPGDPLFGMIGDEKVCYSAHLSAISLNASADLVAGNTITVTINGFVLRGVSFKYTSEKTFKEIANAIDQSDEIRAMGIDAFFREDEPRKVFLQGPGLTITASAAVAGGSSQAVFTIAPFTQFKFIGVAVLEQLAYGKETGYYPASTSVGVLTNGKIYIRVAESAKPEDKKPAYVIMSGSDAGKFTDVSSGNYDCGCIFRSGRFEKELALIEVRGMN